MIEKLSVHDRSFSRILKFGRFFGMISGNSFTHVLFLDIHGLTTVFDIPGT